MIKFNADEVFGCEGKSVPPMFCGGVYWDGEKYIIRPPMFGFFGTECLPFGEGTFKWNFNKEGGVQVKKLWFGFAGAEGLPFGSGIFFTT